MMARAKKEAALTPEERLQAALVPDWEWPYKLPENWCWTRLGNISTVVGGGTPSSSVAEYYENGTIPWISPADLSGYNDMYILRGAKNITKLGLEKSSARLMPAGTVCLSSRAPIGYVAIAKNEICTNQGFKSVLPSPCFIPEYLYWYLKGNKELLESYASGTTFLEISGSKVAQVEFPLAPLAEQQRIVDRIESLFAKLDEAKEKAQAVVDSFETRKAAILHKAFTGELTAKWREEHGVGMESWETAMLSDVGEVITGSTPDTKHPEFYGGDVPFIKPTELNQGRHVAYSADSLTEEGKKVSRPIRAGTTCICCIGAISKCGFLEVDAVTNQQINSVVPYSFMDDAYVYYYCCSSGFKNELISNASATTLPIINKKKTSLLNITYPEKPEQTEIVRILDDLFAKEQQAKDAAEAVLEKINLMKKAILARAFRGELGTNDPNDEPAVELLKKIL